MFPLIFRVYSFRTKQIKAAKQSEAKSREGIKTCPNMILKVFQSGRKLVNFRWFFLGECNRQRLQETKLIEPPHIERHPCGKWDLGKRWRGNESTQRCPSPCWFAKTKAHLSIQDAIFLHVQVCVWNNLYLKKCESDVFHGLLEKWIEFDANPGSSKDELRISRGNIHISRNGNWTIQFGAS